MPAVAIDGKALFHELRHRHRRTQAEGMALIECPSYCSIGYAAIASAIAANHLRGRYDGKMHSS